MKTFFGKIIITSVFLIIFADIHQVHGQQRIKWVSACNILENLIYGLRPGKSIDRMNKSLTKEIQERGVNFTLDSEDEKSYKKIGASGLLIKAIRENFSKEFQYQIDLYKKFTDNYAGKTIEQKKIAIDAAKEFIKKFGDLEDNKNIIEYFKRIIPVLEKQITPETQK